MTVADQPIAVQIADAVADELNGVSFSEAFQAERLYVPRYELTEMDTLKVSVLAVSAEAVLSTRNQTQDDYRVDVAIQKRFNCEDNLNIDPLLGFVQEVADFFRFKRLAGYTAATWIATQIDPLYVPQHIESFFQFTSVVRLTYRLHR